MFKKSLSAGFFTHEKLILLMEPVELIGLTSSLVTCRVGQSFESLYEFCGRIVGILNPNFKPVRIVLVETNLKHILQCFNFLGYLNKFMATLFLHFQGI